MDDLAYAEHLRGLGFDEKEIPQRIKDREYFIAKIKQRLESNKEPREITCANYERAIKRTKKEVESFMTGKFK